MTMSLSAWSIGIGSITTEMQEKQFYVTKDVSNDSPVAKFVTVEVHQVDNPFDMKAMSKQHKDVLVSPATLFLPPHQTRGIKLYYQGERDATERYYALSFIEQSLTSVSETKTGASVSAKQRVRLSSVLVVRPRIIRFTFEQDGNGEVRNTGNTFLHVTATGKCMEPGQKALQPCSPSQFLLPGESGDMRRSKDLRELYGVGVWKGDDYRYFPLDKSMQKISAPST
ncbi:hypothetical protein WK03_11070 [Burkholderia cepacia]|uniref:EcpB family pilus assembly chaperone n=1 Tax=Burkholderia cepacia TaxID=292 RepID=UPI00076CACD8|nr:hypothetical protein [Burkholderia cepacia]KVQ47740.1 hypothetical protein WK03_11070 [Burkholderia cepacia]